MPLIGLGATYRVDVSLLLIMAFRPVQKQSRGVPQGSILGRLLFLLYINDLCNVCSTSVPLLYADDTNLFYKGKDIDTLVRGINFELGNISTWLKVNKLSLNVEKTTLYAI